MFFCESVVGQRTFTFVQLCDPQLGMSGYGKEKAFQKFYELDKESLRKAVIKINDLKPDFVIVCGDFVQNASDSSFEDFISIKNDLKMQCYLAPGNHDVGTVPNDATLAFYRKLFGQDYYSFKHKHCRFIVTNSQLWMSDIKGESKMHDVWFKQTIAKRSLIKNRQIVIGHVPIFVELPNEQNDYFNIPLEKRIELLRLFEENNVVAYLSGHKHLPISNSYKGIQLVTGESTSFHFDGSPLGFQLWTVSKDTIVHQFIPFLE